MERDTAAQPNKEGFAEYLHDESRAVGHADSISFPRTEAELLESLCNCCANGELITVQGGRTGLAGGAVPYGGHIINLMHMCLITGMREDSEGRFYLRVQPGMVLSNLTKMIENRRFITIDWDADSLAAYASFQNAPEQFFPTDPTEKSASLGGMVACNASGARSFRYGAMRKHISGLRIALIDGDILNLNRNETFAKGRTLTVRTMSGRCIHLTLPSYNVPQCKSAAGYYVSDDMDAIDLFIGSDGTLGIVTEIEIALSPLPKTIWAVTSFFNREEDALSFVIEVRDRFRKYLGALEYFDKNALMLLKTQQRENPAFARLPVPSGTFDCAIYSELHCSTAEEARTLIFSLGETMQQIGANENDTWVANTTFNYDKLIFFRHAAPEIVNMTIDQRKKTHPIITKLGTDMAVRDEHLREVMAIYRESLNSNNLEHAIWGHIGDNHLHVNILPRNEEEYLRGKALYKEWAAKIVQMGGTVSAEHSIGKLKTEFLLLMYGQNHIDEMAALRRQFDPKGLLSRGNLFILEEGNA